MNRKIYYWKLRTTELQLGERTLIMGILNVTPDSFSDGGHFSDPDRAYARALEMEEQGVDIIDIGAESTRPGSKRISADEEWQRLVPVLKRLRGQITVPLSLDTYKPQTAERAFEYGIEIVNDPSGLTFDADLAKVAANANAGLILNHMRGQPETWSKLAPMPDVIGTIARDLEATVSRARRAGVEKNRIVVDPGIGFGKRKEQNSEILAHLSRLAALDYPILVGPSRKAFLGQITGGAEHALLHATAAAVSVAILHGAHIVRVHDVREMRAVAQVADDIVRAGFVAPKVEPEANERPTARPRPRDVRFPDDERATPARPPLAPKAPVKPAEPEAVPDIAAEAPAVEIPAVETPAAKPAPVRRPPQDKPSRGWTPAPDREARNGAAPPPPRRNSDSKPPYRGSSQDRPPRRDSEDRPPYRSAAGDRPSRGSSEGKPPYRGSSQDRPPRRDSEGRPPYRSAAGDRPSRGSSEGKPPYRGSSQDRPPRRDSDSRPPYRGASEDRPSRGSSEGKPPYRSSNGDRPPNRSSSQDRPPRRDSDSRPPYRSASGDRPPRREFGDRPAGGPPRGPSRGGPPRGGPPKRPFRKRP